MLSAKVQEVCLLRGLGEKPRSPEPWWPLSSQAQHQSPSHVMLLLKFGVYVSTGPNRKMLILKSYWIDILVVTNISVISVYQRNNHSSSDIAR